MPRLRLSLGLMLAILPASEFTEAQDNGLNDLRAALVILRGHSQEHRDTRGATSALTEIKHRLRDWAEIQLRTFDGETDEDGFNRKLQEAEARAGLLCPNGCPLTALGYADAVRVRRQAGVLQNDVLEMQTNIGIGCGYDDSAYLYERRGGIWKRIFETEQNTYTPTGYVPQTIYAVQISEADASGGRLVLTLGSKPGCSNAYQPLYYRLWRIAGAGARPRLLLDRSETAYIGAYPPVRATLSANDVRIEFTAGGTGYGEAHQAERHFTVSSAGALQAEPIAPTPRDFVEEWLAAPWKQVARWSEAAGLEAAHDRLHRPDAMGDFPDPPVACAGQDNLWEIGIRLHGAEAKTYYLVRWRQPDHFALVDVSDRSRCQP